MNMYFLNAFSSFMGNIFSAERTASFPRSNFHQGAFVGLIAC